MSLFAVKCVGGHSFCVSFQVIFEIFCLNLANRMTKLICKTVPSTILITYLYCLRSSKVYHWSYLTIIMAFSYLLIKICRYIHVICLHLMPSTHISNIHSGKWNVKALPQTTGSTSPQWPPVPSTYWLEVTLASHIVLYDTLQY